MLLHVTYWLLIKLTFFAVLLQPVLDGTDQLFQAFVYTSDVNLVDLPGGSFIY